MDDECDIDTITAFLEASDSEEEEEREEKTSGANQAKEADGATEEAHAAISNNNEDDFADDIEGDDLDELDALVSQSVSDLNETEEERLVIDEPDDPVQDSSHVPDCNNDEQIDRTDGDTEKMEEVEEENDTGNGDSETTGNNVDLIKAEMAAMAERMRQLQEMLEKKSSPQSSKPAAVSSSSKISSPKPTTPGSTVKKSSSKAVPTVNSEKKCASSSLRSKQTCSVSKSLAMGKKESSLSETKATVNKTSPSNSTKKKPVCQDLARSGASVTKRTQNSAAESHKSSSRSVHKEFQADRVEVNPFFEQHGHTQSTVVKQSAPEEKSQNTSITAKDVFGDSDDSDWDELDGGEKAQLTTEGRELKKLISGGPRKREAHTPSFDPSILKKPASCWGGLDSSRPFQSTLPMKKIVPEKPLLNPETGTVSGKYRVRDEYKQKPATLHQEDERESVTDPFCGIRIVNPRISMDDFKSKMSGRMMIKISRLLSKYGTSDLQKDNWVTMGVVVHKTEPRQSANGKTYCIWKLSDLQNCEKTVTFFLFGNVYKEHWKHELGIVVGLLNPSIMDKAEKNQAEVAVTINHPQQMLFMGVSKDLGRCRGTTKSGQPCSSFINKMQGEYCTYHVQAAYRKTSSKRTELQGSTGVTPKAFQQGKKSNKQECFFYGGNTFTTMRPQKSNKDKVTISKLHSQAKSSSVSKVNTMSLHELKPEGEKKLQMIEQKDKALLDLLSVPSAGAMNFVKHLVKQETDADTAETEKEKGLPANVTGADLLKQHQKSLKKQRVQGKAHDPLAALPKLGRGFGSGQALSLDVPVKKGGAAAELAKQLAIAKVRAKGGIDKEDPNALRKKMTSPEAKDRVKKRVAEDMDHEVKVHGSKETTEPPRKKSKLLGNVDLNSPEVQALLKSKSKHKGALAEAEAEHEEKYFNSLEKKERMEDKMDSIMEVPVTLIHCAKCDYTYFSAHDRCKQERHVLKRVKGKKRFFKCKTCKYRTISLDKICTSACKNCGGYTFERVSMLKERSGPKLESEQLSLRGNEEKYVGSIQGKANMNV